MLACPPLYNSCPPPHTLCHTLTARGASRLVCREVQACQDVIVC
ncbi:hypothetical protein E2C01_059854 [Portunus trituberculatus]|uniref:Uncharacterized protein n=1 Tax=Portunus trituberculatus TaxID=210409 RepID=A0A5B7H9T2_PORTR|nr:hypothetical protein [Portunus trituberculatus]